MGAVNSTLTLNARYRIERQIRRGGTALIYEAFDLIRKRRCAVKILAAALTTPEDALDRLRVESETLLRMRHPNIVEFYDLGRRADGSFYLVLELLEGEDLSQLLRRERRLSWQRTLAIVEQLADALSFLHAQSIVHRDIKPANIFLCRQSADGSSAPDPLVKLLDFGVVLARGVRVARAPLTSHGQVLGSLSYMSPEAACGVSELIDEGADLWALATVIYQLLTGSLPLVHRPKKSEPMRRPMLTGVGAGADVPAHVFGVLRRALDPDPAQRYQSANELRAALKDPDFADRAVEISERSAVASCAPSASRKVSAPVPIRRRDTLFRVAFALVFVLFNTAGFYVLRHRLRQLQPRRNRLAEPGRKTLHADPAQSSTRHPD